MDFAGILVLSLIVPIFALIVFIMIRTVIRKEIPDSRYTPIDQMTGQTAVVNHEQKETKREDEAKGDDKD